jgi:hypothetical protein
MALPTVGQVIAQLRPGDTPLVINPTAPFWGGYGNATGMILCIDMWGAGGSGGTGSFVGKDGFVGGGGAAGNFSRVYVQTQNNLFNQGFNILANVDLTISAGRMSIAFTPQTGISSATLNAISGATGGSWTPPLGTRQAIAGAAATATAVSQLVQSPAGTNFVYAPGTTLPVWPFDIESTVVIPGFPTEQQFTSSAILNSTDLQMQFLPGLAGVGGWQGGAGGAPTEAGGVRAGWGGAGTARSRTDLPAVPGQAMTVVYLVALQ